MNAITMRMKSIAYEQAPPAPGGIHFEQVVTVRRILVTATALIIFAMMALGASTAHGSVSGSWYSSFESGAQHSKRTGKPLLVMIARTGCHACAEMEQNLAASSSRRALSGAIKVRVESSNNPELTSRFAAGGTPTTVIFAPGNYQSPIYQYTGVMDTNTIRQVGRSLDSMN